MDAILGIAAKYGLKLWRMPLRRWCGIKGRKVCSFGDMAALSFSHEESWWFGDAGMVLTNDEAVCESRMLRENGSCKNMNMRFGIQQSAG